MTKRYNKRGRKAQTPHSIVKKMARQMRVVQKCDFCDIQYSPMPVWKRGEELVHVHAIRFTSDAAVPDETCETIAREKGYAPLQVNHNVAIHPM